MQRRITQCLEADLLGERGDGIGCRRHGGRRGSTRKGFSRAALILLSVLVSTMAPMAAQALSSELQAALNHVGQVMAGEVVCPRVAASQSSLALIIVGHGGNLADPAQAQIVKDKARETVAAWKGKDTDAACAAVLMLYGPRGANVPGLVRAK
jgi:hypothetical protein